MKREATIKELNGIVISDPSYDETVWWCSYRNNSKFTNWEMKFESEIKNQEKYPYIDFSVALGDHKYMDKIRIEDYKIYYPHNVDLEKHEIGMDTACVCVSNKINFDYFGETIAIHTGTDGIFGEVLDFKVKGKTVCILLMASIDSDFIDENSLFVQIAQCLNAKEKVVDIDKKIADAKDMGIKNKPAKSKTAGQEYKGK